MARTFYPRKTKLVTASKPHEGGTEYKVSIGDEEWGDGTFQTVVKVQMVYDGKVSGRMSPSYPIGSGDWKLVQSAIEELVGDIDGNITSFVNTSGASIMAELDEIIQLTESKPSSERMQYLGMRSGYIPENMTGIFEYSFFHLMDDLKLLCDFNEKEGLHTCNEVLNRVEQLTSDNENFIQTLIDSVEAIKTILDSRNIND